VRHPNHLLTGILLTILAGVSFAGMDALGKYTTTLLPIVQVVWGRYVFQTLILSAYLAATTGKAFLRTRHPVLQVIRGLVLLSATFLMYQAIARVPLADAIAVIFFAPIVVTLLSVVFLKERVGVHRSSAVVAGFIGVLLIIRPEVGSIDPALMFALAASIFNAVYLLLTRHLAGKEDAASTQFNTTATGSLILSVVVLPGWETPDSAAFALLFALGAAGAVGYFILVSAFSYAPASLLSPFLYTQVLAAGVISLVLFRDPLRPGMILGTAILVASGLYIWWRENLRSRAVPAAAET
jgi:drug/metabolite transporter (DMT)-like permease